MARQEQPNYERTRALREREPEGRRVPHAHGPKTDQRYSLNEQSSEGPTSLGRTRVGTDRAMAVGSTLVVAFLSTRNFVSAAIDERHCDNDGAVDNLPACFGHLHDR